MVVCSNCGKTVQEGKFCEKCGQPLVPKENVSPEVNAENNSGIQGSVGGFFDKIGSSINKTATDLMAVKSNFTDGVLIFMSNKIPNVQEKKIKVDDAECVYYNKGNGFVKYNQTFMTTDNDFLCFYVRNVTTIQNSFAVEFKTAIKNLNDTDVINIKATYNLELISSDIDMFFNTLISMKQDTWKVIDINTMLSTQLNRIISENTINMLKEDGNLDLRDVKAQISKFTDNITNLINNEVAKYGLKVNMFKLFNAETNMAEINKILIDNLYR